MSLLKKIITAILVASIIISASSIAVSALTDETVEQDFILSQDTLDEDSLPDSDELITGYLEKDIYPQVSTFGRSAYDLLNEQEQSFYTTIKSGISSVASGGTTVTAFEITSELSDFSWTASELGVQQLISGGSLTTETEEAIKSKVQSMVTTGDIMRALTSDIPCELFWFDKTEGMQTSFSSAAQGSKAWISKFVFYFNVSADFKGSSDYTVNPLKISPITTAKQTAQGIVAKHADKSDIEKLTAYKNEICALTDYYSGNLDGAYGNPWQLIWVFDNDASTDVVCEGYAKAFKYLCDLSTFSSPVYCYIVTGDMTTASSTGPHMWNLVEIIGKNYLVDVTNSDDNSIGDDGSLFMVGTVSMNNGAINKINGVATYSYDTYNIGNYLEDGVFLPVSQTSYAHDSLNLFTVTVNGGEGSGYYAEGATVTIMANPTDNQRFDGWTVIGETVTLDYEFSETATFTMPAQDVTVVATYHTHTYEDTLVYDDESHWYEYTCGCEGKHQMALHILEYEIIKEATCAESGKARFFCACGHKYACGIEKTSHKYDYGFLIKQATVNEEGEKRFTCEECGHSYIETVPKLTSSESDKNDASDTDVELDDDDTETDADVLYDEPAIPNGCGASVSTTALALVCILGLAIAPKKEKGQK